MTKTRTAIMADYFRERPGIWISAIELLQLDPLAWRTEVSRCRAKFGMVIEWQERREGKKKYSEYRYVPPSVPQDVVEESAWALL